MVACEECDNCGQMVYTEDDEKGITTKIIYAEVEKKQHPAGRYPSEYRVAHIRC